MIHCEILQFKVQKENPVKRKKKQKKKTERKSHFLIKADSLFYFQDEKENENENQGREKKNVIP